ncbi:hypothetical protein QL285_092390 [Trifolium repens]|jgi:hypothetical protein|nr:hypothetical protein QL285_092390 [Trifolium repens]
MCPIVETNGIGANRKTCIEGTHQSDQGKYEGRCLQFSIRQGPTGNPTKTMESSQDRVIIDNSAHKEHNKFIFNGQEGSGSLWFSLSKLASFTSLVLFMFRYRTLLMSGTRVTELKLNTELPASFASLTNGFTSFIIIDKRQRVVKGMERGRGAGEGVSGEVGITRSYP